MSDKDRREDPDTNIRNWEVLRKEKEKKESEENNDEEDDDDD